MKTKNALKSAILMSILSILLCMTMFLGTTFAWFTDTASTSVQTITAGNIDVELQYYDGTVDASGKYNEDKWVSAEGKNIPLLNEAGTKFIPSEQIVWDLNSKYKIPELRVVSKGNTAIKYELAIGCGLPEEGEKDLAEVIKLKVNGTTSVAEYDDTLRNHIKNGIKYSGIIKQGNTKEEIVIYSFELYMPTDVPTEYNGSKLNGLSFTVVATQAPSETDSEGNAYDSSAVLPDVWTGAVTDINSLANSIEENMLEIGTAADLAGFAKGVNEGNEALASCNVKLTNNISLSNLPWTPIGDREVNVTDNAGNITTESRPFKGTFDGNGYAISDMNCTANEAGLFGYVEGGTITNLTVNGITTGKTVAAGIVAVLNGGNVVECHSNVDVVITNLPAASVGENSQSATEKVPYNDLIGKIITK